MKVAVHAHRTFRNLSERDVREQQRRVARRVQRQVRLVETVRDDAPNAVLIVIALDQDLATGHRQHPLEPLGPLGPLGPLTRQIYLHHVTHDDNRVVLADLSVPSPE